MSEIRHHLSEEQHTLTNLAGLTAIAAVIIYFLLFADFALVEHGRRSVGEAGLGNLMIVVGLSGALGSLAAAFRFKPDNGSGPLTAGFAGCALAACLSLWTSHAIAAYASGILTGACLGWTTVLLTLSLRPTLHLKKLGLCCGLGTGAAYAFCSQPLVFSATPRTQSAIAIFVALAGLAASFRLRSEPIKPSTSNDFRPFLAGIFVLLFLILACLDSAAFFIIQRNPIVKADTWENVVTLQGNAFVHLCAAVLAGIALDRRQLALTLGTALLALLGSCVFLTGADRHFPAARACYTVGVSIGTTALVFYPARSGRPWLAGLLLSIFLWFGTAAGICYAQWHPTLSRPLLVITGLVVVTAFMIRHFRLKYLHATGEASRHDNP